MRLASLIDPKNPKLTTIASLSVVISASVWGIYWLPLRTLEEMGITGGWSIAMINAPAAMALSVVFLFGKAHHRTDLQTALTIGLFTGLGLSLYGVALLYAPVVRVTLLFYLTPVWATVLGMIFLAERASWARWIAISVGLLGLFLLVSGGGEGALTIGDFYGFLSGVAWAIGATLIKRFDGAPLVGMCMWQFWTTVCFAILLGVFAGDVGLPPIAAFLEGLPIGVALSLGLFLPGVLIIFWAQKVLFPGRVGLLMMSEVLVAVLSASLLIPEERLGSIEWIGAILILSACFIEVLGTPSDANAATRQGI